MPLSQHEQDYLFDLRGYLVVDDAVDAGQLARIDSWIDGQPEVPMGTWLGHVETHTYSGREGVNYQNIVEGGEVFEELIDQPSWIGCVRRWIENDYNHVSINEAFVNVRRAGGFIGMHSGGHTAAPVTSFRHAQTSAWQVGQINVLVALTDIGPGDGATTVIPGSHKSSIPHPDLHGRKQEVYRDDIPMGAALGAVELHLRRGQAAVFTDAICHGSAERLNAGERRVLIYRYSPHAFATRYRYVPSEALMARLTPARRAIIDPVPLRLAPGQALGAAAVAMR